MNKNNKTGLFIFLVAILLVLTISARTPVDTDMWWHLRSGQATVENGSPLLTDPFSFTRQGEEWTNHSWLAQVFLYLIYQAAGPAGMAIFTSILATISIALIYRLMEGPPILKAFLAILAGSACSMVWTARPQMFSLVFFAGLFLLLAIFKQKRRAPLWLVPVLFAVWSNLHAGFALGLILLIVFLAAEIANRFLFYPASDCLSWAEIRSLSLWSLSAVPALLLNPNGIKTWLIPFQTVGVTALQNKILEWASPDFHILGMQLILWLLFLLILAFSLAGRRLSMADILIPLTFAYMTFLARRNVGPFAMAAIPAISRGLMAAWQTWRERITPESGLGKWIHSDGPERLRVSNKEVNPAVSRIMNLTIIAFLGLLAFGRLGIVSLDRTVELAVEDGFPVGAVRYLQQNNITGNLFNEYNWGGYLIFSNPQNPIYLDGRTDLFGDELIGEWENVILAHPDWESILEKWEVRAVLLQPNRPVTTLLKDHGWQIAYQDTKSVLFIKQ